jgi:RNA polymerase sigma factor (sigma-70 family)
MSKRWELTGEALDGLLTWLDSDREQAGRKYEHIRKSLIKIFAWRGCAEAEDLADETINRVARKVPEIASTYKGNPALYFYGVGRKLLLEYQKQQLRRAPQEPDAESAVNITGEEAASAAELERRHDCLEQCLQKLSESNHALIRDYYQRDLQTKGDSRRELARRLGASAGALRVRAHRLRADLLDCIRDCLAKGAE